MEAGQLSITLVDCHVYENQLDQIAEQLSREPRMLPQLKTSSAGGIFEWTHKDVEWVGYNPYPPIEAKVAV